MKFLIFDLYGTGAPYLIMQDCKEALRQLGHETKIFNLQEVRKLSKDEIKKQILACGIDFVFTINHIGFTLEFLLALKAVGLPYISWFIDNPFFRINRRLLLHSVSPNCILFTWDKTYIRKIGELGFKNTFYLPIGVNEKIFRKYDLTEVVHYSCDVSFAGASMYSHYQTYYEEGVSDQKTQNIIKQVIDLQSANPMLDVSTVLTEMQEIFNHRIKFENLKLKGTEPFEMCLEEAAASKYRKELIKAISDLDFHLYGDRGWVRLLGANVKYLGLIKRREELAKLYNATKVNLNITKPQSKTSLPMRVFEICACDAFMLSDYKRDLSELFTLDEEIICYRDKEDLRSKILYFLRHPDERAQIAKQAQRRVFEEHTYLRRMKQMIENIRGVFGKV
jgi:spore maturation protein CgeB